MLVGSYYGDAGKKNKKWSKGLFILLNQGCGYLHTHVIVANSDWMYDCFLKDQNSCPALREYATTFPLTIF